MTQERLLWLFETLLNNKWQTDLLNMQLGYEPKTLAKYLIDYLYKQLGLKSEVVKQLSSLVVSLERASNSD